MNIDLTTYGIIFWTMWIVGATILGYGLFREPDWSTYRDTLGDIAQHQYYLDHTVAFRWRCVGGAILTVAILIPLYVQYY